MLKLKTSYHLLTPADLGFECDRQMTDVIWGCMNYDSERRPAFRQLWFLFNEYFSNNDEIYDTLECILLVMLCSN